LATSLGSREMYLDERLMGTLSEGAILETAPAKDTVRLLGRVGAEARTNGAEAIRPDNFLRNGPMQL
jgi:hypothetical protein